MPVCGAAGCGFASAELLCSVCGGVFYCNSNCQRADWRRHKRFCKSASVAMPAQPGKDTEVAAESTCDLDRQLSELVIPILRMAGQQPNELKKRLPACLVKAKALLAQGARPDTLLTAVPATKLLLCVAQVATTYLYGRGNPTGAGIYTTILRWQRRQELASRPQSVPR